MRIIMSASVALALLSSVAWATGDYGDSATAQWFSNLRVTIPGAGIDIGCCDQSDCHETQAVYQDGGWWAESRRFPGEWVRVPAANVLNQPNPLMNAVLCEAAGGRSEFQAATVPSGFGEALYCFVPPPLGF